MSLRFGALLLAFPLMISNALAAATPSDGASHQAPVVAAPAETRPPRRRLRRLRGSRLRQLPAAPCSGGDGIGRAGREERNALQVAPNAPTHRAPFSSPRGGCMASWVVVSRLGSAPGA